MVLRKKPPKCIAKIWKFSNLQNYLSKLEGYKRRWGPQIISNHKVLSLSFHLMCRSQVYVKNWESYRCLKLRVMRALITPYMDTICGTPLIYFRRLLRRINTRIWRWMWRRRLEIVQERICSTKYFYTFNLLCRSTRYTFWDTESISNLVLESLFGSEKFKIGCRSEILS